jgi:hypothetical protein
LQVASSDAIDHGCFEQGLAMSISAVGKSTGMVCALVLSGQIQVLA